MSSDRLSPVGGELPWSVRDALATIAGPSDSGPWITVYREAGGGYEGLQAIAREALALLDAVVPSRVGDGDAREAGRAVVVQNEPPHGGYAVEVDGIGVVVPETNSMSAAEAAAAINAANGLAPARPSPQQKDPDAPTIPEPPGGVQDTPARETPELSHAEVTVLIRAMAGNFVERDAPLRLPLLRKLAKWARALAGEETTDA